LETLVGCLHVQFGGHTSKLLVASFTHLYHPPIPMGYGIHVVKLRLEEGDERQAFLEEEFEELYLSYNWSELSTYWDIEDDMFGQCGEVVIDNLRRAIDQLKEEGVKEVAPDMKNPNWGWGCMVNPTYNILSDPNGLSFEQTIPLPADERKSVFLFHLKTFLVKALKHPHAFFLDEEFRFRPPLVDFQGKKFQVVITNDDDTEVEEVFHAYYRHPIHGTMCVDTFAKAMEIYGFAKASSDPRMEAWWKLALTLPGAPQL